MSTPVASDSPASASGGVAPATSPMAALQPGKVRVGWIGTGVMGISMCGHLLTAGYDCMAYNRTAEKVAPLLAKGGKQAKTVQEVAENCDIVFTIVGYPTDVRQVYLGDPTTGQKGILDVLKPGAITVDMTTSDPSLAKEIAAYAQTRGIHALDAPVSGGDIGAKEARLSIMVGGDAAVMSAVEPLFACMGKNITHCGSEAGSGQHTKLVNQILIASTMIGAVEGLLYARKAGLDPLTVIKAVSSGAAGSWTISNLGPKIVARNFDPGFYVEHFVKDMGLALGECNRMRLALPGLALANQLYTAVMALGHQKLSTTSLTLALEALNGIPPAERK